MGKKVEENITKKITMLLNLCKDEVLEDTIIEIASYSELFNKSNTIEAIKNREFSSRDISLEINNLLFLRKISKRNFARSLEIVNKFSIENLREKLFENITDENFINISNMAKYAIREYSISSI